MTGERPIAPATDAVPLLWEAFELLTDRPCFALRRDPARTSHALAAAIERFLDDLRVRHDAVLSVLPDLTSRIYLACRDDERSSEAIASLLGLSADEVERRLDDAIFALAGVCGVVAVRRRAG